MGTPQTSTTVTYNPPNGVSTPVTYHNPTPTPAPYIPPPITQAEQDKKGEWLDTVLPPGPNGEYGGYPTGGGTSGGSADPPPPPPPPAPKLPTFVSFTDDRYSIKVAPRDTVIFDQDQEPIQLIQELLYEQLGGVELANMSRSDLIDGQQVSYSAIANLLQINRMYNPNNIVSSGDAGQGNFSIYSIDLLSRGISVPEFDDDGNIVIRIDEINSGELIEYQIALNGTIDRVDST